MTDQTKSTRPPALPTHNFPAHDEACVTHAEIGGHVTIAMPNGGAVQIRVCNVVQSYQAPTGKQKRGRTVTDVVLETTVTWPDVAEQRARFLG